MVDTQMTHYKNGLAQKQMMFNTGFTITVSIATGVCGESTCLMIHDSNCYPDNDSRSERPRDYIIPIDSADDLNDLVKCIQETLKDRKKTLIKEKVG